jgi:hypothetical protein
LSPEQIVEYEKNMASHSAAKPSVEERLVTLDNLNSKGLLSADEYVQKRALILSEV